MKILRYMYQDVIVVEPEHLLDLTQAAGHWQMADLSRRCEGLLLEAMDLANCISLLWWSEQGYFTFLRDAALAFIKRNFELLKDTEDGLALSEDIRSEMKRRFTVYDSALEAGGDGVAGAGGAAAMTLPGL